MADQKKPLHDNVVNGIIGWVVVAAVAAWMANFLFGVYYEWGSEPNADRGTFGDVFGAVNSVFSGFAFVGVVWSLILQRIELRVAKEDRDKTLGTMKLQQFENTFFQLVNAFTHVKSNIEVGYRIEDLDPDRDETQTVTMSDADFDAFEGRMITKHGIDAFDAVMFFLEDKFMREIVNSGISHKRAIENAFDHIFKDYFDEIGRYTRTVYTLVQFIDSSEIEDHRKPFYVKLVRAQLSQGESNFIAINYLSPETTPEFNALIIKYGLAKNANMQNKLLATFMRVIPPNVYGNTYANAVQQITAKTDKS